MQAQLDYQSQNGEFNEYVKDLLTSAMGADGELLTNSDLVDLLKEQENWAAMSDVSKDVWEEELNGTFKEVAAFILKILHTLSLQKYQLTMKHNWRRIYERTKLYLRCRTRCACCYK